MNKCIFTGRLVNDPEMSFYEKEGQTQSIAKYRLAINKSNYMDKRFILWILSLNLRNLQSLKIL